MANCSKLQYKCIPKYPYFFQAGELPDDVDWAFVFRVDPDGNVSRVYSTIPERRFVDLPGSPTQPSVHSNGNHANYGHFDSNVSILFHSLDHFSICYVD